MRKWVFAQIDMELDVELDSIEVKAALRKEVGELCLVDWRFQVKDASKTWIREK